jgi:O-antigen/teichoic acid export membrane protein
MTPFRLRFRVWPTGHAGAVARVLFANVLNNSASFVVIVHAARRYGPEEFGKLGLVLSIMMFAATLLDCGSSISFVRNFNNTSDPRHREHLASALIRFKVGAAAIVLLLSFPCALLLRAAFPVLRGHEVLLTLGVLSAALLSLWTSVRALEQARRDFASFARYNYVYGGLRLVVYGVLLAAGIKGLAVVIWSQYTFPLILLLAWTLLWRERRTWASFGETINDLALSLRSLLAYGWWLAAATLCSSLLLRLPQFALARNASAHDLGLYGAAMSFLAAFTMVNDAVASVIVPDASSLTSAASRIEFRRAFFQHLPALSGLLALLLVCCMLAQRLLLGHAYSESVPLFAILGCTTAVNICLSAHNTMIHAYGRPQLLFLSDFARVLVLLGAISLIHHPGSVEVAALYGVVLVGGNTILALYLGRRLRNDRSSLARQHSPLGVAHEESRT